MDFTYNFGKNYAFVELSGESPDPDRVYEEVLKCVENFKKSGFSQRQTDICKKALYGSYIKEFNTLEHIAQKYVSAAFLGGDYLTRGEKLLAVDKKPADEVLKDAMNQSTLSVVNGGNKK